jgi:two-component system, OmpR family, sensor histidine kinase MprB
MTLRARLAAVSGLAVALAVLATAVFTYVAVRSSLRGEVDQSLEKRAEGLGDIGRAGPPETRAAPPPEAGQGPVLGAPGRALLRPGREAGGRFGGAEGYAQFILPSGQVIRPPGADTALPAGDRARELARSGEGSFLADTEVGGTHLRVFTQAAPGGGAVQVARPLDEIDSQLRRILIALIVVGAAGIAFGVALGAVVARTALLPIGRFTRRTETLGADGDLSQRMEVVGNDELARLALSFNSNLDALERSVEAQRHLVADASHELRTPIASLRANIQTLQDADRLPEDERARMRDDIVEELDELTALVGDVVELARGAKPAEVHDEVRLDRLVGDLVERARRRAGTSLEFELSLEPAVVRGEPERIGRAVSNLLGNAAKWSPPGGVVEVSLEDAVLTVRDHGPGFDQADLPHVFERFYRAAAARGTSGSGLGLAIVEQAAESHGGFAEAANAPGGGALVRVGFGPGLAMTEDAEASPALSPRSPAV